MKTTIVIAKRNGKEINFETKEVSNSELFQMVWKYKIKGAMLTMMNLFL